jgi:hypothetical protein
VTRSLVFTTGCTPLTDTGHRGIGITGGSPRLPDRVPKLRHGRAGRKVLPAVVPPGQRQVKSSSDSYITINWNIQGNMVRATTIRMSGETTALLDGLKQNPREMMSSGAWRRWRMTMNRSRLHEETAAHRYRNNRPDSVFHLYRISGEVGLYSVHLLAGEHPPWFV